MESTGSKRLKKALELEHVVDSNRTLTDADIEAILEAAKSRFYKDLGKGFWGIVWKAVLVVLIGIAAHGYYTK